MDNLPDGSDVLEDLTRRESVEQVRRAVLSLPPVYREVVVLCEFQDSSYEEAALALDCPVGTIRSRLNRARGMLASNGAVVRSNPAINRSIAAEIASSSINARCCSVTRRPFARSQ